MKLIIFFLLSLLIFVSISTSSTKKSTALALYKKSKLDKDQVIIFGGNFVMGLLSYWFGPLEGLRYALEDTFADKDDEECYYANILKDYHQLKDQLEVDQIAAREDMKARQEETEELLQLQKEDDNCTKEKKEKYKQLKMKEKELRKNRKEKEKKLEKMKKDIEQNKPNKPTPQELKDLEYTLYYIEQGDKNTLRIMAEAKPQNCFKHAMKKTFTKIGHFFKSNKQIVIDFLKRNFIASTAMGKKLIKCLLKHKGDAFDEFVELKLYNLADSAFNLVGKMIGGIVEKIFEKVTSVFWFLMDVYYLIKAVKEKCLRDIGFYLGRVVGDIIGYFTETRRKFRRLR